MFTPFLKEKVKEIVLDSFPIRNFSLDLDLNPSRALLLKDEGEQRIIPEVFISNLEKFFKRRLKEFIPESAKCFVAGGSVMTYFLYQNYFLINDIDIFPASDLHFSILKSHLDAKAESEAIRITETINARKYHFHKRIELIKHVNPTIEVLFKTFDFNVCKFGFDVENGNFEFKTQCNLTHLFNFDLKVDNFKKYKTAEEKSQFLSRLLKYINKGFNLSKVQQKEVFFYLFNNKKNTLEEERQLYKEIENSFSDPYVFEKSSQEVELPF